MPAIQLDWDGLGEAKASSITWSEKQKAIFQHIAEGKQNLLVEACAGGAKTSTIVEATKHIPKGRSAIFVAFNKSIADTLGTKLPPYVQSGTLHSVANNAMKSLGWAKVNGRKTSNILQYELVNIEDKDQKAWYYENYKDIVRTISKAKGFLTELTPRELLDLALDEGLEDSFYLRSYLHPCYIKSLDFKGGEKGRCVIDFDDMLRIPVVNECPFTKYDYVFIDEAQDLNDIQREICIRLLAANGCLVAVGDRKQAIYAFRGASHNSMDLISEKFNCLSLPLDVSYRCSKAVVQEAQKLYPNIHPTDWAKDGAVVNCHPLALVRNLKEGDMVLCRTNAPLLSSALKTLIAKKKVCILSGGLDSVLSNHLTKFKKEYGEEAFQADMHSYIKGKIPDGAKKSVLAYYHDLTNCLCSLFNGERSSTVAELRSRLNTLFANADQGTAGAITFSTIHKAKGLEAERVFLLNPDGLPHPFATTLEELKQEKNLHYVAVTRAKDTFIYVTEEKR